MLRADAAGKHARTKRGIAKVLALNGPVLLRRRKWSPTLEGEPRGENDR